MLEGEGGDGVEGEGVEGDEGDALEGDEVVCDLVKWDLVEWDAEECDSEWCDAEEWDAEEWDAEEWDGAKEGDAEEFLLEALFSPMDGFLSKEDFFPQDLSSQTDLPSQDDSRWLEGFVSHISSAGSLFIACVDVEYSGIEPPELK